jgi:uncharacterized delta-60 repeat protein
MFPTKRLIFSPRIAAATVLFVAFLPITRELTATNSNIDGLARAVPQSTLGPIETDGTLDSPFDAGKFTNGQVIAAALQPDGKLLIGGQFNKLHGVARQDIARVNADGTLDLSFTPDGFWTSGVKAFILQTDGKIIVLGPYGGIGRLNSDGSNDTSFDLNRVVSIDGFDDGSGGATYRGTVYSAVLQPDGKIVVAGNFFYVITGPGASVARSCVARFNSDGSFDPSFDPGAGASLGVNPFDTVVNFAVRQSLGTNSGKIVIQGQFDVFDGHDQVHGLVRLNTNGSFDNTFTPGTTTDDMYSVLGLLTQADDRIVVFGSFTSFTNVPCSGLVRFSTSGVMDGGFATAEFKNYDDVAAINKVAQQPNGKLLVGGQFHSLGGVTANNLVRLEGNGGRDASFDPVAAGPSASNVDAILVRPSDGKIFVGGYFSTYGGAPRNNMAWANGDGSVDSTFTGLSGATDAYPQIGALATQPDGKILVGGSFTSVNGTSHNNIVRLNPDSTIDPSFDPNLGTCGSVNEIRIQPDGKILIVGNLQAVNGVARGRIARLDSDGTLDTSFDPGTGADYGIYALAQDSDGNTYIGGAFGYFNGVSRNSVAKLTPTGALDPAFNQSGGGANGNVYAIAPPDGAGGIVIGGSFFTYDGLHARYIARLNTTSGALDTGFNPGGAGFNSRVQALLRAPDGKYYAGGLFFTYNGVHRYNVARLNADGTLDGTYVGPPATATIAQVTAMALQNGKIVAGGVITNPPGNIMRLTSSGDLDPTFVTGTGFALSPTNFFVNGLPFVDALATQADGKLLVGGVFNKYNGTTRICLARLAAPPAGTTSTLGNISTRLRVETGDNALIGGFIVTGTQPKKVIIRAIGPSLPLAGALANPVLELRNSSGGLVASNDNWRSDQEAEIIATTIPPSNDLESAIVATLPANNSAYTAIVRGVNDSTGIGVVEAYDLDRAVDSKLANISTRGFVQTEDNVLIGGLIVLAGSPLQVVVRAIGPSLAVAGVLGDPTLELRNGDGTLIASNDNWRSDQEAEITATTIPPSNDLESAIVRSLSPGNYTAIVRGVNNTTGVALVEVYGLN